MIVAGLNGFLLSILTPPFEVHDEFQHFFRSYQISEGKFWGEIKGGRAGGSLPVSLSRLVENDWGTLEIWKVPKSNQHPLIRTLKGLDQPLEPTRRQFTDFSGAAPYSPLPYIPQAMAIALGRSLDASPVTLLYLGRFANVLASVGMIGLSLIILPYGRPAAVAMGLLPMAQYEYGSLAPDAGIIATAYLFTAITLRCGLRGSWTARDMLLAGLSGIVLTSIKIVYLPLLLIGLPASFLRARVDSEERKHALKGLVVQAAIVVISTAIAIWWLKSSAYLSNAFLTGERIHDEVAYLISHPFHIFLLCVLDMIVHGGFYLKDMIGIFGVWTVPLPGIAYLVAISSFALALISDRNPHSLSRRSPRWDMLMCVGVVIGIQLAMAVLNNSPGQWIIMGVQGRYFLPITMMLGVAFTTLMPAKFKLRNRALGQLVLSVLLLINTVIMDFSIVYGFGLFV